ncbi:MAG: NAD(P)-binding domain-containing protein, partial [Thaumarchaeota archaeon]|nr:NAD(P)-binding domain-containing protein [Nitrososphaerota archaeon]
MGSGLARQLAKTHEIIIGSRDAAKASAKASEIQGAKGADYLTAARECEVAIFAVPYSAVDSLGGLAEGLAGKLVISIINPMKFEGGMLLYGLQSGSAAEELAKKLPGSRVATAFNNITVGFFTKAETPRL